MAQLLCALSQILLPAAAAGVLAREANVTAPAGAVADQANAPAAQASTPTVQADKPAAEASTSAAQGGAPAKVQAPLQLIYRTVALPTGHVGTAYGPRRIVEGGLPPYTFAFTGKFPPGLALAADGVLAGTPDTAGRYAFQLMVRDSSAPAVTTQQPYVLRIEMEKPSAQNPPVTLTREEADAVANPHPDAPVTYMLTLEALKSALAEHSGAGAAEVGTGLSSGGESSAAAAPNRASTRDDGTAATAPASPGSSADSTAINVEQLQAVVAPVINVEYPSAFLFRAALDAAHCAYYQNALLQRGGGKSPVDAKCPPSKETSTGTVKSSAAATKPGGKPADSPTQQTGIESVLTLRQYYEQLLPDSVRDSLVSAAQQFHPMNGSLPPNLTGAGCGCAPQNGQDEVYGFYPFWDATSAVQPIDFSLFTRIGYMGALLNPSGGYTTPPNWLDQKGNFARTVHRFHTRLDLVVYRQEWGWLGWLSEKQIRTLAEQAAGAAIDMVDSPVQDPPILRPFWLPFWRESDHAYDGLTIFFDYPHERSRFDASGVEKFQLFLSDYLHQAILTMQHNGRAYNLNLVVPDDLLGEDGPFSYHNLINYIELAEPATTRKGTAAEDDFAQYKGTSPITVDILVLMREPTGEQKKLLRAAIDELVAPYDGHRRVALLQSVVPVIFHRAGPQQGPAADLHGSELDKDIAYYQWTYGGVGLWPVPVTTIGDGAAVMSVLRKDFTVAGSAASSELEAASANATVCRYVCPNRDPVRLLFELLVLVSLGLGTAHAVTCRIRRARGLYLSLLVSSACALVCGGLLLNCDPTLHALKQSNWLLLCLIVGLGLFILYESYKPRVSRP